MSVETRVFDGTMTTQVSNPGEGNMVRRLLWEAIRRVAEVEGLSIRGLSRRFELDRKTIRRCLKGGDWQPYRRAEHEALNATLSGLLVIARTLRPQGGGGRWLGHRAESAL